MTHKRSLEPSDLYRLRLISDVQIAPNGQRIAYVLRQMDEAENDYLTNIYTVDRAGCVTQLTAGNKDWAPRWSPDGASLAFLSRRKETPQIYLLSMSGGESVPLTDLPYGAGVPVWSPDSTTIAFTGVISAEPEDENDGSDGLDGKNVAKTKISSRTAYKLDGAGYIGNRRRHLFLIDVPTRTVKQLTEGDFNDDNPAWSPDGLHLAFASNRVPTWDYSLQSDIYIQPRGGGEPRRLTSDGSYRFPAFSADGSRVACIGNQDPEASFFPARLYSVDRSGSDLRDELGAWDGDLGYTLTSDVLQAGQQHAVVLTPRSDGFYFLGTERGESNVYRAEGCSTVPVTRGRHAITDFSVADDGAIAYSCGNATRLAEVFLQTDGETQQLTHENDTFLSEIEIIVPERVPFTGADGVQSEGWLLAPRGHESGKHPLIMYIHGGPMLAHGEALFFEYQFLAGKGIGIFYPNIHGSSSYGSDYQTSIHGDWGNRDYADILAATDEVVSRPWVDPHRLGVAGGSYGGYMTNWVITHTDRFRAALTERTLCNIVSFMGTSDIGWMWNRMVGGYPEEDVQKLWDMSPIKYINNVTTPTLVIHSEGDDRTPVEQGEQMFNTLRRLGKETKLIVFPEESHGLTRIGKPSRRVERLDHVLEWFRARL